MTDWEAYELSLKPDEHMSHEKRIARLEAIDQFLKSRGNLITFTVQSFMWWKRRYAPQVEITAQGASQMFRAHAKAFGIERLEHIKRSVWRIQK